MSKPYKEPMRPAARMNKSDDSVTDLLSFLAWFLTFIAAVAAGAWALWTSSGGTLNLRTVWLSVFLFLIILALKGR